MANIILANQTIPATPSSGNTTLYTETTTKRLHSLGDDGVGRLIQPITNANTADQSISANTNTYITGASLLLPPCAVAAPTSGLRAGSTFRWVICLSKTAGQTGTATPSWTIVFGTAGSIADTARLTFTGVAMTTSIADTMQVNIDVVCRVASASVGVIEGVYAATHLGAAATQITGLMNQPTDVKQATSGSFDTTVASSTIGLGLNLGANTAGTILHASVIGFNL